MANSDGPFLQFANLAKHVSKPPHHTYRYFKLSKFKYSLYFSMWVLDPIQVKFRLLISSIFDAMNFQHFLEMLEIMLQAALPKNARNTLYQKC